jgi:putative transposase
MGYLKVYIHFVWTTKNHVHYLQNGIRQKVFDHIMDNAKIKGIHIDCINGYTDHVHCLISMSPTQSIAQVINLIKGESSFWINKNKLTPQKFEWQDDYWGESINKDDDLERVRKYIYNQEEHHRKVTYAEEYARLLL